MEVISTLPSYVRWLNKSEGKGSISFNETSRDITWKVSTIAPQDSAQISFQVELKPSKSQVGTSPTVLGSQRMKATDRFTGTVLRASMDALSTKLSTEAGFKESDGEVVSE